jgi:signal transduction histidine kinase
VAHPRRDAANGIARPRNARAARRQQAGSLDHLRALIREQSALRTVATLIAREASPAEVLAAVAREVALCLDIPLISIVRLREGTATQVGVWGRENPFPVGLTWALDGTGVAARVAGSGKPARVDDYAEVPGRIAARLAREAGIHSAVGVPIRVEGRLWGVMMAMSTRDRPLADNTVARLGSFTELVGTAIANAQARDDLHQLLEEQSALRRVATLVAQAAPPGEIFDSVCRETGRLIGASTVNLAHFTPDGFNHTMAGWSRHGVHMPTGTRLPLLGDSINALVQQTSAPGRIDSYEDLAGPLADRLRGLGVRSEVGAPVVVGGRVWGALIAGTDEAVPLPRGTEERVASFAELIATAVGNAADRSELIASRARIVAAADDARRRLARDLHDGAQQRLVSLVVRLQLAKQHQDSSPDKAHRLLDQALQDARAGIDELRELAAGVHPSILTNRGLQAAINSVADRCSVPVSVSVSVPDERHSPLIEAAAYFVAAEALTNVDKHAHASKADVRVSVADRRLILEVHDDGSGGATFSGSGLVGLRDRVEALGGVFALESSPGQGTQLCASLPLSADC